MTFSDGGAGSRLEMERRIQRPGRTERHTERTTIRQRNGNEFLCETVYDDRHTDVHPYYFRDNDGEMQCGNGSEGLSWKTLPPEILRVGSRRIPCKVIERLDREPAYYRDDPIREKISRQVEWRDGSSGSTNDLKLVVYWPDKLYRDGRRVPGHVWQTIWTSDLDAGLRVEGVCYRCRVVRAVYQNDDGRVTSSTTTWVADGLPITYLRNVEVEVDSTGAKTRTEERLRSFQLVP